jgi:hypothetical protein
MEYDRNTLGYYYQRLIHPLRDIIAEYTGTFTETLEQLELGDHPIFHIKTAGQAFVDKPYQKKLSYKILRDEHTLCGKWTLIMYHDRAMIFDYIPEPEDFDMLFDMAKIQLLVNLNHTRSYTGWVWDIIEYGGSSVEHDKIHCVPPGMTLLLTDESLTQRVLTMSRFTWLDLGIDIPG